MTDLISEIFRMIPFEVFFYACIAIGVLFAVGLLLAARKQEGRPPFWHWWF